MLIAEQCSGHTWAMSSGSDVEHEDPRVELDIVQAEVARVAQTLKALMDKTHILQSKINDMYSPVVRLLPPEIVAEIFQACIPAFDMEDVASTQNAIPLMLGSVCSSWRRIAWGAPTLWCSLTLRLNTSTVNTQMVLLEEWLSRSGDLPLSLRLLSEEEIHWASTTTPGTAIEVIRKYASRWRDLDLRLPTSCYKFLPGSDESLPRLHSLNLNPPGGQGERRHRVDMSGSAKIQHLSLSCVYLISMKFQWTHVTHLRLEAFYVDECLEALRQSPQLEACSLRNIIGGDDGHTLPEAPLILPALHTLSIENEKDTHIALLLQTIALPKAKYFSYSGRNLVQLNSLSDLISRSPALETVAIEHTNISSDDVFETLIRSLRTVKKFTYKTASMHATNSPLSDDILRLCNPLLTPSQECLLPQLECLEYRGPHTFSWDVMLETLESRTPKPLGHPAREVGPSPDEVRAGVGAAEGAVLSEKVDTTSDTASRNPNASEPEQKFIKIHDWQSLSLNLVRRAIEPPNLLTTDGQLQRLARLALKPNIVLTDIDSDNKEVVHRLM